MDQSETFSEPKATRKLGRQNKYDIKAVSWNPHSAREDIVASTVSVCVCVCVCVCVRARVLTEMKTGINHFVFSCEFQCLQKIILWNEYV